jgi:biopolymer transport protein ExbD
MKIKRRKLEAGIPTVALADIAFNLVLFFLLLAKSQDDTYLKWNPAMSAKVEHVGQSLASVTIDINSKVYFNGQQMGGGELAPAVKAALGNLPAGKRTVLLKVDKSAPAQVFEPVIEAISEAGGDLVHILAEQKK